MWLHGRWPCLMGLGLPVLRSNRKMPLTALILHQILPKSPIQTRAEPKTHFPRCTGGALICDGAAGSRPLLPSPCPDHPGADDVPGATKATGAAVK